MAYKGVMGLRPPRLIGGKNILFTTCNRHFTDISEAAGILRRERTYGLGVPPRFRQRRLARHLRCQRSTASALIKIAKTESSRHRDGAGCALSADGKARKPEWCFRADYDLDGTSKS